MPLEVVRSNNYTETVGVQGNVDDGDNLEEKVAPAEASLQFADPYEDGNNDTEHVNVGGPAQHADTEADASPAPFFTTFGDHVDHTEQPSRTTTTTIVQPEKVLQYLKVILQRNKRDTRLQSKSAQQILEQVKFEGGERVRSDSARKIEAACTWNLVEQVKKDLAGVLLQAQQEAEAQKTLLKHLVHQVREQRKDRVVNGFAREREKKEMWEKFTELKKLLAEAKTRDNAQVIVLKDIAKLLTGKKTQQRDDQQHQLERLQQGEVLRTIEVKLNLLLGQMKESQARSERDQHDSGKLVAQMHYSQGQVHNKLSTMNRLLAQLTSNQQGNEAQVAVASAAQHQPTAFHNAGQQQQHQAVHSDAHGRVMSQIDQQFHERQQTRHERRQFLEILEVKREERRQFMQLLRQGREERHQAHQWINASAAGPPRMDMQGCRDPVLIESEGPGQRGRISSAPATGRAGPSPVALARKEESAMQRYFHSGERHGGGAFEENHQTNKRRREA